MSTQALFRALNLKGLSLETCGGKVPSYLGLDTDVILESSLRSVASSRQQNRGPEPSSLREQQLAIQELC